MTTPAKNILTIVNEPIQRCVSSGNPGPITCSIVANEPRRWLKDVRPASGSVPLIDGYRKCRAWVHYGHTWSYNHPRVDVQWDYGSFKTVYRFMNGGFWEKFTPPVPDAVSSNVKNRAEQAALLKLKSMNFNLGQFLAEWKRTSELLATGAERIAKSVKWYRKNYPDLWKAVKRWQRGGCLKENWHKIPRSWLELQYGWKPLMSDIWAAAAALNAVERPPVIHVKGYAGNTGVKSTFIPGYFNGWEVEIEHETKEQAWVSLYYELNTPALSALSSLGLVDPALIVWELLPYSFVVDWFLPVGNWLASMTADVGFSFNGGSLSVKSEVIGGKRKSVTHPSPGGNIRVIDSEPSASGSSYFFERTCYNGSPVPGLYFKNPLSATHMLNAIALLSLAFRK